MGDTDFMSRLNQLNANRIKGEKAASDIFKQAGVDGFLTNDQKYTTLFNTDKANISKVEQVKRRGDETELVPVDFEKGNGGVEGLERREGLERGKGEKKFKMQANDYVEKWTEPNRNILSDKKIAKYMKEEGLSYYELVTNRIRNYTIDKKAVPNPNIYNENEEVKILYNFKESYGIDTNDPKKIAEWANEKMQRYINYIESLYPKEMSSKLVKNEIKNLNRVNKREKELLRDISEIQSLKGNSQQLTKSQIRDYAIQVSDAKYHTELDEITINPDITDPSTFPEIPMDLGTELDNSLIETLVTIYGHEKGHRYDWIIKNLGLFGKNEYPPEIMKLIKETTDLKQISKYTTKHQKYLLNPLERIARGRQIQDFLYLLNDIPFSISMDDLKYYNSVFEDGFPEEMVLEAAFNYPKFFGDNNMYEFIDTFKNRKALAKFINATRIAIPLGTGSIAASKGKD
jgi:hypothetical protein